MADARGSSCWRLVFELPPGRADAFEEQLWALGAEAVTVPVAERGPVRLEALFPCEPTSALPAMLASALVSRGKVEERDWMEPYRRAARPLRVTPALVVDPREPTVARDPEGRAATRGSEFRLRIPARNAFGTGSHPSTRLVIEWLEQLELAGQVVLDVGSGSGILSFYALMRGAERVIGFDVDLDSVLVSSSSRRLNRLEPGLFAGGVAALAAAARFDLLLVNVLPDRIRGDLERLRRLVAAGGCAIFSGVAVTAAVSAQDALKRSGWRLTGERRLDDWIAWRAQPVRVLR